MFKKIFKNTGYLTISQIINKILFLILVIFIARFLGADGLGKYAFIFAFIMIIYPLADFGLAPLTTRTIARDKSKASKFMGNLIVLRLISGFLTYIISVIIINLIPTSQDVKFSIYLAGLMLAIISIKGAFIPIFQAYQKMKYQSIAEITEYVIIVSLGLIFLLKGYGIIAIIIAFIIGKFASLLVSSLIIYTRFPKSIFEIDFQLWKWLIKNGFYFWMQALLFFLIFKIDIIMLNYFKGNQITGLYEAAFSIVRNFQIFPILFLVSLYPELSNLFIKSKKKLDVLYKRSSFYIILFNLIISISILLFANKIILLIYGKEFFGSILALKLLIIPSFILAINYVDHFYLNAINKHYINPIIVVIGVITNIILNLSLIPKYSMIGAIIASIIAYSVNLIIRKTYIFCINKKTKCQ